MKKEAKTINNLNKLSDKKNNFIEYSLNEYNKSLEKLDKRLYEQFLDNYITKFTITDGKIALNERNLRLLDNIEGEFDKFNRIYQTPVLQTLSSNMLAVTDFQIDYYLEMGFSEKLLQKIAKSAEIDKALRMRIGIGLDGKVIENSFIGQLANGTRLKEDLKTYVIRSITNKASLTDFQKGFKELLISTEETNSLLTRYSKRFVHDTFFQVARAEDKVFADRLELNHAIFSGSKIKTTREFCAERIGQVFSRAEIETWAELEWAGKSDPYDPYIDIGGWNCRHDFRFISYDLAVYLAPEKFAA